MKTTATNKELINLINMAIDSNGFLINPKSQKNKTVAQKLLNSGINFYDETVNGFNAHDALLIIAFPNKNF